MRKIIFGLLALVVAGPLWADNKMSQEEIRSLKESGAIRPLEEILAASKTVRPGRVMEVELEKKNDTYIYEIVIADEDGAVWELKFNAKDASLISQQQDD